LKNAFPTGTTRRIAAESSGFSPPSLTEPTQTFEHARQGVVAFVFIPIFALAHAGVPLVGAASARRSLIARGIVLGLVLGKPVGITLASYLAVHLCASDLPPSIG
jgi:Na+:H+ antiporter, NhaA family